MLDKRFSPVWTHNPVWRLALVSAMLLAFLFQSYVTQTHIHIEQAPPLGLSDSGAKLNTAATKHDNQKRDNFPANDDPANCPICQQNLIAGQYVAPAALVFFLAVSAVSTIEIADSVLPHFDSVSHSWRGRGPPLV